MRPKTISDEDILRIAMECVLEEGPSVSTTTIAERIGVSQATLFKRFGSKVELLRRALFIPLKVRKIFSILREPEGKTASDQMKYIYQQLYSFFDDMVPCWSMLHSAGIRIREGSLEDNDPPVKGRRIIEDWIRDITSIFSSARDGYGKAKVPIKRKQNGINFFNFIRYLSFTNNR